MMDFNENVIFMNTNVKNLDDQKWTILALIIPCIYNKSYYV